MSKQERLGGKKETNGNFRNVIYNCWNKNGVLAIKNTLDKKTT